MASLQGALNQTRDAVIAAMASINICGGGVVIEKHSETEGELICTNLGVSILVDMEGHRRNSIGGNFRLVPSWTVYARTEDGRCRPTPPDVDYKVEGHYISMIDAVAEAAALYVKDDVTNRLLAQANADALKEWG